jgi:hypothetical protein
MDERRRFDRHEHVFPAEIKDLGTGRLVGLVADISSGGMMLRAEAPLDRQQKLQLRVELPPASGEQEPVPFEARVRWCEPDLEPATHVIGLEFGGKTPPGGTIAELLLKALKS